MKYTPKQYAAALYQALQETKPDHHDRVLDNFVSVLQQQGNLGRFSDIETAFGAIERAAKGIKTAEVTATRKLAPGEEEQIMKGLNSYLGSKIELKTKIDQSILGGVVVRFDDQLIDGSIQGNLRELKNELTT